MRRALLFIVIIVILIGSGFLTVQLAQQANNTGAPPVPGMRVQTNNPEASALVATTTKGSIFLAFAGFVIFNMVGIGATLAVIFWFLNRSINRAKVAPNREFSFSLAADKPNSLGGTIARRPAIAIGGLIVVVVGAALALALLGLFSPR